MTWRACGEWPVLHGTERLQRGRVWCRMCGVTHPVNVTYCMAHRWPTCCGETMTLDSPQERALPPPTPPPRADEVGRA